MIPSSLPLHVEPTSYAALVQQSPPPSARADDRIRSRKDYSVEVIQDSIARVPVFGLWGGGWFSLPPWAIQVMLKNILYDDAITHVILDFDTPGGSAQQHLETIALIQQIKQAGKTVIAFSAGDCLSMGYFLASTCDLIVGTPTSRWGSISTYLYTYDQSEAFASQGIRPVGIATGKFKAVGLPGLPIDEEQEAELIRPALTSDAEFKEHVTQHRPALSPDYHEGQYFTAKDAPVGLIDSVAPDLDTLIASLL